MALARRARLLADQERGFLGRLTDRVEAAFDRFIAHLVTLVRTSLVTVAPAIRRGQFWFTGLKFDEPQHDAALALAGTAHSPQAVDDGRLDLDEALAVLALHGPPRGALRQRRGDRVKGGLGEGDANHRRERDSCQTVISGPKFDETKPEKKTREASHAKVRPYHQSNRRIAILESLVQRILHGNEHQICRWRSSVDRVGRQSRQDPAFRGRRG